MAPGATRDAVEIAAIACVAHATLAVVFAASAIAENAEPFSAVFRVLARGVFEAYSATFRFPLFASAAFCWRVGSAVAASALAERYRFRPQTLEGAAAAAAPLLASLVMHEAPWVQHCAFEDLCAIAEERGGGHRAASTGRGRGRADGGGGGRRAFGRRAFGRFGLSVFERFGLRARDPFARRGGGRGSAGAALRGSAGRGKAAARTRPRPPPRSRPSSPSPPRRAAMEKHLEAVREGGGI